MPADRGKWIVLVINAEIEPDPHKVHSIVKQVIIDWKLKRPEPLTAYALAVIELPRRVEVVANQVVAVALPDFIAAADYVDWLRGFSVEKFAYDTSGNWFVVAVVLIATFAHEDFDQMNRQVFRLVGRRVSF